MDILNLVVDLAKQPTNPKAYLECLASLISGAHSLGLIAKPVVALRDSGRGLDALLGHPALSGALVVTGSTAAEVGELAAMAVQSAPTLVLGRGGVVAPDFLPRAMEHFRKTGSETLVYPEMGVLYDRGSVEILSYSDPSIHGSAVSGISQFAPICLGPGPLVAKLLRRGGFLNDLLSRHCWLESWQIRNSNLLKPLPESLFFVDHPIHPIATEPGLSRKLEAAPAWLKREASQLARLERRTPCHSHPRTYIPRPISRKQECDIQQTERMLSHEITGVLVAGSPQNPLEKILIDSLAQTSPTETFAVFTSSSSGTFKCGTKDSRLLNIGIADWLPSLEDDVRARILLAILSTKSLRFLHLFEAPLSVHLLKALSISPGIERVSVTLLPDHSWASPFLHHLISPELLAEIRNISILSFAPEHRISRTLKAYDLGVLEQSPLAPWTWRSEIKQDKVEPVPTAHDFELAMSFATEQLSPRRTDTLMLGHMFPSYSEALQDLRAPIPCGYVSMRAPEDRPSTGKLLLRDGALPLIHFFSREKAPDSDAVTYLVEERLASYVPDTWRHCTRLYRFNSRTAAPLSVRRLVLCGEACPKISSLNALELELSELAQRVPTGTSIECFFPTRDWKEDHGSKFFVRLVRCVRRALKGFEVRWLDEEAFLKLRPEDGLAFREVGSGVIFAFGSEAWHLLSIGVPMFGLSRSEAALERIPLSPSHWAEVFSTEEKGDVSHSLIDAALRESAPTHAFSGLLERARLI